jgi:hypothetical protein
MSVYAYVCVYKVPRYNFQIKPIKHNKMVRHLPLIMFNQSLVEIIMQNFMKNSFEPGPSLFLSLPSLPFSLSRSLVQSRQGAAAASHLAGDTCRH